MGAKNDCSANCMCVSVKVQLDQGDKTSVETGREVREKCFFFFHQFYSSYTVSTLPKKLLKGMETSNYDNK